MKVLIPVDASKAALAPIEHLAALKSSGVQIEALVLNVQPRFHKHVAQFTSKAARDALRAERSAAALTPAIEQLARWNLPFVALTEIGRPADCIARVAEREAVDEIVMGVGRYPEWVRWVNPSIAEAVMARTDIPLTVLSRGRAGALQRYAIPVGIAGLAAILWAVE